MTLQKKKKKKSCAKFVQNLCQACAKSTYWRVKIKDLIS